ncbi:hypothetical protein G9P44_004086 [Scheffersomyces stipitis]|nr:hypothetical protein G9P44_004086 [Scheffersomyces stipitis]
MEVNPVHLERKESAYQPVQESHDQANDQVDTVLNEDVNRVESVDAPEVVVATSEQYDPLVQEEEDLEDYEPRIDHEQVGGSDSEVSVSHPAEEAQDEEEEYDPEAAFNEFEQELKHEQNQETEVRKIENHEPQSVVENPETERSHEGENFETQTNFANHETEPVNEKVNHDETHVIERHNTDHLTESSTPENQTEANKPNHDQELDGTHNFENVIEKDDDLQMRNPVDDVEDELYVRKTNVEDNADEENDEDEDDYDPESALDRNIKPSQSPVPINVASEPENKPLNPILKGKSPVDSLPPKPQVGGFKSSPSLPPAPTSQQDIRQAYEAIMQSDLVKDPNFVNLSQTEQMKLIQDQLEKRQMNLAGKIDPDMNYDQVYSYNKPYKNLKDPIPLIPVNKFCRRPNITAPMTPEEEAAYKDFIKTEADYLDSVTWEEFPDNSRLFIGNLPANTISKQDLFRIFSKYGEVIQIAIKAGYGFAQFKTAEACLECIKGESNVPLHNKMMRLDASKPQKVKKQTKPEFSAGGSDESFGTKKFIPDCQLYITGKSPVFFIRKVKKTFANSQITIDTEDVTHKDIGDVISEAAYSGVLAACIIKELKVDVQTFESTEDGGVKFDEYADIDPEVAVEILTKAKEKRYGNNLPQYIPQEESYNEKSYGEKSYEKPHNETSLPQQPYGFRQQHDQSQYGGYEDNQGYRKRSGPGYSAGSYKRQHYNQNYRQHRHGDWGKHHQNNQQQQPYGQPPPFQAQLPYGQPPPPPSNNYTSSTQNYSQPNSFSQQNQQNQYHRQQINQHHQGPQTQYNQGPQNQYNQRPKQQYQEPPQIQHQPPPQIQYQQSQVPVNSNSSNIAQALQGLDASQVQNVINILQQQQQQAPPPLQPQVPQLLIQRQPLSYVQAPQINYGGYNQQQQSPQPEQYGNAPLNNPASSQVNALLSQLNRNNSNIQGYQGSSQSNSTSTLMETLARLSRKQ